MKKITILTDDKTALIIAQAVFDKHTIDMRIESVKEINDEEVPCQAPSRVAHRLPDGKTMLDIIREHMPMNKRVSYDQFKKLISEYGFNPSGATSMLSILRQAGYLEQVGRGSSSTIITIKEIPEDTKLKDIRAYLDSMK